MSKSLRQRTFVRLRKVNMETVDDLLCLARMKDLTRILSDLSVAKIRDILPTLAAAHTGPAAAGMQTNRRALK